MMPGAINTALQTGQMPQPQPAQAGTDPRRKQAIMQDPRFAALAQQVGPEMAMQILMGEQTQARAATSSGVQALGQVTQQEDPRAQMASMMQQARA